MKAKRFNYENKQYLERLEKSGDKIYSKYLFYIKNCFPTKKNHF